VAASAPVATAPTIIPTRPSYPSENAKWGHLAASYLKGNGIELATGGSPIVPTSIQFELSEASYRRYNSGQPLRGPVQWRSDRAIFNLPFLDGVLDYVASSHLIEDYADWEQLLREWTRVLKVGGTLLVCAPEKRRWMEALAKGQPPNCAHKREPYLGEISNEVMRLRLPYSIVCERFTDVPRGDYNIMAVFRRT
jgi:SAM-dependent methyltransferase